MSDDPARLACLIFTFLVCPIYLLSFHDGFSGKFINGLAGFGVAMIAMPLIAPFNDFKGAVTSCTEYLSHF
jgi:hypothetical protein